MIGKKSKLKIYKTNDGIALGSYNLLENTIGIFHGLDRFPKLKQMVLEHEMKHAEEPKEFLVVLRRELKDYSKIYETDEYWEYRRYYKEKELERGLWWYFKFTYLYSYAVYFIYIYMMIRGMIINRWRRWRNDKSI